MRHRLLSWVWRISVMGILASVGFATPASATSLGGTTISPPLAKLTLEPKQAQVSLSIRVANNQDYAQEYQISSRDFGSLDQSGGITFLETQAAAGSQYGLAQWLTLDQSDIIVPAHSTQTVTATIQNSTKLLPGAHYGAVLFTKQAANTKPGVVLPLRQVLTSLVFLAKLGGEQSGMKLKQVVVEKNWWRGPHINISFINTGNTFVVPRGVVRILDPFGREVGRAAVNEASSLILPGGERSYLVIPQLKHSLWPGWYRLQLDYRYDGRDQFSHYQASLFYINWLVIVTILGLIIGLGALLRRLFGKSSKSSTK